MSLYETFWKHFDRKSSPRGCWLWLRSTTPNGYGRLRTPTGFDYVHRVSWAKFFKRDVPEGRLVLHKCDTRRCGNPEHLFLGSNHDNTQDMLRKRRHRVEKLSDEEVRYIRKRLRKRWRRGRTIAAKLAVRFGVSLTTIYDVARRRSYKHVE